MAWLYCSKFSIWKNYFLVPSGWGGNSRDRRT